MAQKRRKRSNRRRQGQREPIGLTKRRILLIIANHHPEGIEEADLRDILRKEYNIRESKGVRSHLSDFEERKVLMKDSEGIGHPNIWKINPDEMIFMSFCVSFLRSEQKYEFLKSKYAQQMLTDDFLNSCAQNWYDNYYAPLKEEAKSDAEFLKMLDQFKEIIDSFMDSVSERLFKTSSVKSLLKSDRKVTVNLAKAIRKSPIVLYYLIFPNKAIKTFLELIKELDPIIPELLILKKEFTTQLSKITKRFEGEELAEFELLLQKSDQIDKFLKD